MASPEPEHNARASVRNPHQAVSRSTNAATPTELIGNSLSDESSLAQPAIETQAYPIPITVEHIEPGHCGVMVRCDGPVTGRELIEANEAIAVCHHPRYQLWDFSNATSVSALADDIHQLALQDSAIPDTANLTAILIVGSRESVVKLVHAYELFSSGWVGRRCHYQTKLFGTLNDAQSWLKAELGITDFK